MELVRISALTSGLHGGCLMLFVSQINFVVDYSLCVCHVLQVLG